MSDEQPDTPEPPQEADDPSVDELAQVKDEAPESAGGPSSGDEPNSKDKSKSGDVAKSAKRQPATAADEAAARPLDAAPAYGLAALTGMMMVVAFAGVDIWPLAFITWVPFILAVRGQSVKRATALGAVAGFFQVMIGFYWLTPMLQIFSGFPLPLCLLFAGLLSAYQGCRIALCGWLYARCATRGGWHHGLALAGAFAASELLWPLLFPWYFAGCVHNAPIFMQTAELGGPILVSLVLLSCNLAVAELVWQRWRKHPAADKRTVAAGLAVVALAAAFGAIRMGTVDTLAAASEKVTVGLVQAHIALKKRGPAVRKSLALTKELRKKGAQLVVWSEAAIPSAYNEKTYKIGLRRRVTRKLGVPAVVGGVLYGRRPNAGPKGRKFRLFNSAFMVDGEGNIKGRYDKQYLLMFGEYLPLGDTFPILYQWSPNSGNFSPGTSFDSLEHGKHRIAAMICYEDIIPEFVNKLVETGNPDLLVNLTNDAWFGDSTEPWQHLALAKFRSVEHRMFLARVSNSGVSAIIDPNGRVVVQGETFKQQALIGDARYMRVETVYSIIGNAPWWIVSALMLLASFVRRPKKKQLGQ